MAMRSDKDTSQSSSVDRLQDDGRIKQNAELASIVRASAASPNETAHYVADMLESLEKLANRNELNVLGLMLAMARDQADDDAGKMDMNQVHAAL